MNLHNVEDIYPLSPMQQGILFHARLSPEAALYFEQWTCTIWGALDVAMFQQAWEYTIARHPSLRTLFIWEGLDQPLQIVRWQVQVPWEEQDWRKLPADEQRARFAVFLREDQACGFDLARPPLLRLHLIQLADDTYQFVWSFHHILLDGWSAGLLLHEIMVTYSALRQTQEPPAVPRRPYREYIAWLQQQDLVPAERFWRQALRGFSAATPLAVDRPCKERSSRATYVDHQFRLSAEQTAALQGLAREHQLTLSTLVQGVWAILLGHYSGTTDVVFGAVVAGRPATLAGAESMVGLFINTLPARARMTPNAAVLPWLRDFQDRQAETRQFEHSPLAQVQQWSEVRGGLPLFETVVTFENYAAGGLAVDPGTTGLTIADAQIIERTNYPLAVSVIPGPELAIKLLYDADRFDADTIGRMAGHLSTLLGGIIANPRQHLGNLPLLAETERRQILVDWNATAADYPRDVPIHALFETQAAQRPDTIALVQADLQLTYRALNQRANQLAHHLQRLGAGPETLIGLCVERSPGLIIGILAILKAGGAYLPLDPDYPRERLAFMLRNTRAAFVLTQQSLLATLLPHNAQMLLLDADRPAIERESDTNPYSPLNPHNLAYVIFTSGSTGTPKGVLVTHQGMSNVIMAQCQMFGLSSDSCVLQFASLNFDASIFEMAMAFGAGARLCLGTRAELLPGPELLQFLLRQRVSAVTLTPSTLATLPVQPLPDLRTITVAGESCPSSLVTNWANGRRFFNLYGPTEATIWATAAECQPSELPPSIGHPIANAQTYILDRKWQPVPIGVPGELYIGGDGLARGYLNRPELTAERFIPNPFTDFRFGIFDFGLADEQNPIENPKSKIQNGERLYRTGDLARYRPDGSIEFLGRIDHQVKLRGFRIELGEIEAVLQQHPVVREVVVLAREDQPGDKRLIAYIATNRSSTRVPFQGVCAAVVAHRPPVDVMMRDISHDSIGFAGVPATWRAGQAVRLQLRLRADTDPLCLEGEIVWCEAGAAGVKLAYGAPGTALLQQNIAHLLRSPARLSLAQSTLITELRIFSKRKLPDYMIPSAFVVLDGMPLTFNGKIDRQMLPAPADVRTESEQAFAAPQSDVEQTIARVWRNALHIERIGQHDNFFDLGGHSLLLGQIHSALEGQFEKNISLVDLFTYPTVSSLARFLSQEPWEAPARGNDEPSEEQLLVGRNRLRQQLQQRREQQ